MNNLEFWVEKGMKLIKTEKINKPEAIKLIVVMDDFISSGVSEEELSIGMSKVFEAERHIIKEKLRAKLKEIRKQES